MPSCYTLGGMRLPRSLAALALAGLVAATGTACSSEDPVATPAAAAEAGGAAQADIPNGAAVDPATAAALIASGDVTVIDVRTPQEYGAGHVDGAANLDVQSPQFAAALEELDPQQQYVVYCRSGNRSAVAADAMVAAGLQVVDAGAFDALVAAGAPTP